jgi:serine protease Do
MKQGLRNLIAGIAGGVIVLIIFILFSLGEGGSDAFKNEQAIKRTTVQPEDVNLYRAAYRSIPRDVDFADAADRTVNAVVHIRTEMTRRTDTYDDFFGSLREYLYGHPHHGRSNKLVGFGSGVVLSHDGYIVTNNHVVEGADKIEVTFNDRRVMKAVIVGNDPSTDLALIKVNAEDLAFITYGNSDELKVGEWVLAVGNPFNLTSTVTAGIVSAKARNINILGSRSSIESFIQTDAVINRGNSGGALVNTHGELVGINAAIASRTGVYEGYSFAIPVNIVRKVVDDLISFGEIQRGYIGVEIREMTAELAQDAGQSAIKGVYIAGISESGGAADAGIKAGEVILSVDGKPVNTMSQLLEAVGQYRPGDNVEVVTSKNDRERTYSVMLKNLEGNTEIVKREEQFFNETLGVTLERISPSDKKSLGINHGLRVSELDEGIFKRGGIAKGFIVTNINGQNIDSKTELEAALSNSRSKSTRVQGMYPNGMRISFEFFE